MMESPDDDRDMACPMVLQGAWETKQVLLSLPVNPFTYQVVLARAAGAWVRNSAVSSSRLVRMRFMTFSVVKYACKTKLTNLRGALTGLKRRASDLGLPENGSPSAAAVPSSLLAALIVGRAGDQ